LDRFQVKVSRPVHKDLQVIPPEERLKILKEIAALKENPFPSGTRKKRLKGVKSPLYRLRVGDWRAVYRIEQKTIVLFVIHKRNLEKSLKELL